MRSKTVAAFALRGYMPEISITCVCVFAGGHLGAARLVYPCLPFLRYMPEISFTWVSAGGHLGRIRL